MKVNKKYIEWFINFLSVFLFLMILFQSYQVISNNKTQNILENAKFIDYTNKNKDFLEKIDINTVNNIEKINKYNNSMVQEKTITTNKEKILNILGDKFNYNNFSLFEKKQIESFSLIKKEGNFFIKNDENNNISFSFIKNDQNLFNHIKGDQNFMYQNKLYSVNKFKNFSIIKIHHNFKNFGKYNTYDFIEEFNVKDEGIKYSNSDLYPFYNFPVDLKLYPIEVNKMEGKFISYSILSIAFLLFMLLSYRRKNLKINLKKKEEIKINYVEKIEIKK